MPLLPSDNAPDTSNPGESENGARFEELYERLQAVTARLESGELSLDESLALYDEGMRLAVRCQQLLGEAEQQIEVLRQAFDSGFNAAGR
ncbi:MAG: exodeoxyribonuclease VII small subunit [Dehalococcoidia bacterium]